MVKLVNMLLFVGDVILSLVLYPILYVANVIYLVYVSVKYDIEYKECFRGINKSYIRYIMNGLEIHKKRIKGV